MIDIEAYNDFFFFINERHRIYLKKEAREPKPWTESFIFMDWSFCCVFRRLDKQSKLLYERVAGLHGSDLLFRIFLFRAFNLADTYDFINTNTYLKNWNTQDVKDILYSYLGEENQKLTSGAYMIRGKEGTLKTESIPDSLENIWENKEALTKQILKTNYLENAWKMILDYKFWGWGPFTAYQIVLDLMETPLLQNPLDLNDWCYFGPGAKRGLIEIWPDLKLDQATMLQAAKWLLADQVKYREDHVPELNLQDVEFCLCELSKFRRIKYGGNGKRRYSGI